MGTVGKLLDGYDLVEVDFHPSPAVVQISQQGLGNSLFRMYSPFVVMSGGTPGDDYSNIQPFDGGNPATVFAVSPTRHRNWVGG